MSTEADSTNPTPQNSKEAFENLSRALSEAFAKGVEDAHRAVEEHLPEWKATVARGLYDAAYAAAYGAAFGTGIARSFVPDSIVEGIQKGAAAGKQAAQEARKRKAERAEADAESETPDPEQPIESAWV